MIHYEEQQKNRIEAIISIIMLKLTYYR